MTTTATKSKKDIPAAVAAVLTAPPKAKLVAIGPTIDKLIDLRERKRLLAIQVEEIEKEAVDLEEKLFDKLDAEGTTKGAGSKGSASITTSVVGNVKDWDALHAFVAKKKYFHLLQRRLSDAAVRELFEKGVQVPGVEPFNKRRLNLRSGV